MDGVRSALDPYSMLSSLADGQAVEGSEVVILAVKPDTIAAVLKEVCAGLSPDVLIVSIAAGVSISVLEEVRS